MSKINIAVHRPTVFTFEGGRAVNVNYEAQLRRSVMSCLLWEDEFYEDGQTIAARIMELSAKVDPETLASIINEARNVHGIRHASLLMLLSLIKSAGEGIGDVVANTMRRADDMTELVALYWKFGNNKHMLPRQLKRGLAKSFNKFNEYQLAKYDRDGAVKLRDVLFLARPKPKDEAQAELFKRVADRTMTPPDTWEVALSGGADKRETFTRLITEDKLGYLALLRNLRNMVEAGVDLGLISNAILARKGAGLVFPFRYTAAARVVPQLEPVLDQALQRSILEAPKLKGRTAVLVDVSRSMEARLSAKSDLTRLDAAATLASVINAEQLRVFTFSNQFIEVPPRRGMAGVDAISRSQPHGGTLLFDAVDDVNTKIGYDRLIIITDEQATGSDVRMFGGGLQAGRIHRMPNPLPNTKGYLINVASAKNGVGYNQWTHIDGFSEAVIRYIVESETMLADPV